MFFRKKFLREPSKLAPWFTVKIPHKYFYTERIWKTHFILYYLNGCPDLFFLCGFSWIVEKKKRKMQGREELFIVFGIRSLDLRINSPSQNQL